MIRPAAPQLLAAAVALAVACASPSPEQAAEGLAGSNWRLVEFESSDDAIGVIRPADPSRYTLSLGTDGRVSMRLDCNRGSGAYEDTPTRDDGGALSIGPLAVTRAACPDAALADQLARHVEYFRSYILRDGRLHISLMADGGIYVWEPAGGSVSRARDFDHPAVGALMVYDPTHGEMPGWRPQCGVALVHARVVQTAGHCVQFLRAGLALGSVQAAWISFDRDPVGRFSADPDEEDPATAGWYAIASVHANPDNVDFVALRQADTASVLAAWGTFHDTGAIVLARAVVGIAPLPTANEAAGAVEGLLARSRCALGGAACQLVEVGYGLQEVPPATLPPELVRRSALLRYDRIDSLFVTTFDDLPATGYGRSCPGDSGSPILLVDDDGAVVIVAISSSPVEPFAAVACTGGGLQYRVDTDSHRRFIGDVIRTAGGE
jgi:heat shock protein HslJ